MTASILARDNKIAMRVFALQEENSIVKAADGDFNGTTVTVDWYHILRRLRYEWKVKRV